MYIVHMCIYAFVCVCIYIRAWSQLPAYQIYGYTRFNVSGPGRVYTMMLAVMLAIALAKDVRTKVMTMMTMTVVTMMTMVIMAVRMMQMMMMTKRAAAALRLTV